MPRKIDETQPKPERKLSAKTVPKPQAETVVRSVQDVANEIIDTVRSAVTVQKKPRKPRQPLTDEQKQVLRERLVKAREAKQAKRNVE